MSALLTVRDLAVDFGVGAGAVRAVKQVGFDLDPGETVATVSYTHLTLPTSPKV